MMRHDEDEEEFFEVKTQLAAVERERDHAFDELREMKKKISKTDSHSQDLASIKESLLSANRGLRIKDETIETLRARLKHLESKLAEKDALLCKTKGELSSFKGNGFQKEGLMSDAKKRIEELEAEVRKRKASEAKLQESELAQKKQLEQVSALLGKSKHDVDSIHEKMQALEEENRRKDQTTKDEIERLQNQLQLEREKTSRMDKQDKTASSETKSLSNEVWLLKKELKQAIEAEENSRRAMDDLALALAELAAEAKQAKEKLITTEEQLVSAKEEAENLKKGVKNNKQNSEGLLGETKKENEMLKNTVNRLRQEAEESLVAWNEREKEFVKLIKESDDAKAAIQEENEKLKELLKEAETSSGATKEEIKKLRDILKQALNEANVAKEAANLARAENCHLQDSIAEKDRVLVTLAQETERLRISEAEANESIMELKRIIAAGSRKEAAKVEKEIKEQKKAAAKKEKEPIVECIEKDQKDKRSHSSFSFDLNQLWHNRGGANKANKDSDDDHEADDSLVDSIFDLVESPMKDPPVPELAPASASNRYRRSASTFTDEANNLNFESWDDAEHFDDMEIDRSYQGKKRALLKRFGDLLSRKTAHIHLGHLPREMPKDLPQPHSHLPKDVPKELPHPLDEDMQF